MDSLHYGNIQGIPMEKRDILLNMRGEYSADLPFAPKLELYAEGTLSKKDGAYIIEYSEDKMPGGINLRVVIKDEEVRMQCSGEVDTDFLFTKKQCFLTAYPAEDGIAEVIIFPHDIQSRLSPECGTIDMDYTIRFGDKSAYNKLTIDYKSRN